MKGRAHLILFAYTISWMYFALIHPGGESHGHKPADAVNPRISHARAGASGRHDGHQTGHHSHSHGHGTHAWHSEHDHDAPLAHHHHHLRWEGHAVFSKKPATSGAAVHLAAAARLIPIAHLAEVTLHDLDLPLPRFKSPTYLSNLSLRI